MATAAKRRPFCGSDLQDEQRQRQKHNNDDHYDGDYHRHHHHKERKQFNLIGDGLVASVCAQAAENSTTKSSIHSEMKNNGQAMNLIDQNRLFLENVLDLENLKVDSQTEKNSSRSSFGCRLRPSRRDVLIGQAGGYVCLNCRVLKMAAGRQRESKKDE